MRMAKILQAVGVMMITLIAVSCSSGREYNDRPSNRYNNSRVSLIVSPRPGFTMNRTTDGRHFHRSPQGLIYWQGQDNRFYLDKAQVRKVRYNQREYREWKRFGKKYSKGRRY
jgi:hypothetical protein